MSDVLSSKIFPKHSLVSSCACVSPAGWRRFPQLSRVWWGQFGHGGLHWQEMSLPLPACEGNPRDTRVWKGASSAESTGHKHGDGLLRGVARDQTGHRERQVHSWEHEEQEQGQRGAVFFQLIWIFGDVRFTLYSLYGLSGLLLWYSKLQRRPLVLCEFTGEGVCQ